MCGTTTARGRNGGTWWERRLKRSPRPRRANTLELRAKSRAERIALLFCVRPRFPGFAVPCSPIHGAIFLLPCSLITGEFLTMRKFQMACLCTFLFVVATAVRARSSQSPAANSAGCETVGFLAAHLGGAAEKFNIILPHDYAATGRRFPALYLLHGFSGHYSDWCRNTRIVDYAKPYEEIIVMPEGENSWYVNSATDPKMQWEDYIIEDLIPYVDAHYRTIASRQGRAIAGLSMGGYGAMFLGLKHHEMFAAVASLSGVVASANMARWDKPVTKNKQTIKENPGVQRTLLDDFGPVKNPARKDEDPFLLIRKLTPENCPQLYLAIGWGDSLLGENREFVALLAQLKMPYRYAEVPGKHEWRVWDEQVQRVLALQAPVIGAQLRRN